jgi:phage-related protein
VADASRTIRTRFDGDAGGLVRAAKTGEKAIDQFGRNAGRSFVQRFKAFMTGENDPSTMGSNFGKLFGSGIVRGLAVPGFGPTVFAVLAATLVAAAVPLGGLMAAAIIAGLGAGLVGLGVFFAAQFKVVEVAWSDAIGRMGETMQQLSGPFAPVLVEIAEMVENTFNQFVPTLRDVFADLAPAFEEFTSHLLAAFLQLEPAIQPVSDAFIALMESIGPELPGIVETLAQHLDQIAKTVSANPEAFAAFFTLALDALNLVVGAIAFLALQWSNFYNSLQEVPGRMAGLFAAIAGVVEVVASVILAGLRIVLGAVLGLISGVLNAAASLAEAFNLPFAEQLRAAADGFDAFKDDVIGSLDAATAEVQAWEDTVARMPKEIELKGNIDDLKTKIADAQARLRVAPKDKQVAIKGEISGLQRALSLARAQLAAVQGKTVYIDVITRQRQVLSPRSMAGGTTAFGGDGGAWFANGGDGTSRTEPPLNFTATIPIYLDKQLIASETHSVIAEHESRQAWRATVGRR